MKNLLIALGFILLSPGLMAQDTVREIDVVILKDGSQFKGELLEYNLDSHLILQTSMSQPLRFDISKVDRVIQDYQGEIIEHKEYDYNRNYYQVELGTPMTSQGDYGIEIAGSGIRQFNSKLGIGIGVSYVEYRSNDYYIGDITRIPVVLIYRAYFNEGNVTPYFQFNGGYAFNPHETDYQAGFHANPKLGIRIGQEGLMFHLFLSAHITQSNSDYFNSPWEPGAGWEQKRTIKRTTIGAGISF